MAHDPALNFDLSASGLRWQPQAQVLPRPSPCQLDWLLDRGSLTRRLRRHCGSHFRVRVMEERYVRTLSPSLLQCLDAHVASRRLWSRKVLLQCGEVPWVMAHSLIPVTSMEGPLRCLRSLNERPLGELLFNDPNLRRSGIELTRTGGVIGRRSVFHLHDKPLLVAEFFLPALFDHVDSICC